MNNYLATSLDFADAFRDLVEDQSEWSQATFGLDAERGPIGALKHLEKEAREAVEVANDIANPQLSEELADCFLLILDAARRSGIKPLELVKAAQSKMAINRVRQWPKPTSDEPVEHIVNHRGIVRDGTMCTPGGSGNESHAVRRGVLNQ